MEAGIPVVNVDRLFATPEAARATILGDNYAIGANAATFIAEAARLRGQRRRDPGHRRHLGDRRTAAQGFADTIEDALR